jgi:hypothetical protein
MRRFLFAGTLVFAFIAWLLACERQKPTIVAEVGESQLSLPALRAMAADTDTLSRSEWTARVEYWVNQEVLYREALARGYDKTPKVRALLQNAERKILSDQIRLSLDSALGDVTEANAIDFYDSHKNDFLREKESWRLAKVEFPSMRIARDFLENWKPQRAGAMLLGRPGTLPKNAVLTVESLAPEGDSCFAGPFSLDTQNKFSKPQACDGKVLAYMVIDRLDSGAQLPYPEVKDAVRQMVREERRTRMMETLLTDAKNRFPVYSNIEVLDSL